MSTGPSGGSGGTTGPGNFLRAFMEHLRTSRARARAAAEKAGSRGQSADPLHRRRRERNYQRQNGTERLTPRQQRRVDHKANRAAKRAAV